MTSARSRPATSRAGADPNAVEQSGDAQGLSQAVEAAEQSVRDLAAAGQDYEAQILKGVEDATDHPGQPVPTAAALAIDRAAPVEGRVCADPRDGPGRMVRVMPLRASAE